MDLYLNNAKGKLFTTLQLKGTEVVNMDQTWFLHWYNDE